MSAYASPPLDVEIPALNELFIGGRWRTPATDNTRDVVMPSTEEVLTRVADPSIADGDEAVRAARSAFDKGLWPRMSIEQRIEVCSRFANELEARLDRINRAWTFEAGAPVVVAQGTHQFSALVWRNLLEQAATLRLEESRTSILGETLVTRDPIGVVLAILPYNGPILELGLKLFPGLLAGCTFVVKYAPESQLTSRLVAEACEAAGFPEGVVSFLAADIQTTQHLVGHEGIDLVHLTAGTAVARDVLHQTADRVTRTALELGGKSPVILLEDVDLDAVFATLMIGTCSFAGQVCVTLSRVLAPRSRYEEVVGRLAEQYAAIKVGDPFDPETQQGPLAVQRAVERCERYVAAAEEAGATVVVGGSRPEGLDRGYYFSPTVLRDVDNSMRVAQEEIFGPVTCVIPYDDVEDAVRIANDSPYGLFAAVYGADEERALEIARRMRSGTVAVNGPSPCLLEPFGGVKQSGWGRSGGIEGILGYTEIKSIFKPDLSLFQQAVAPA